MLLVSVSRCSPPVQVLELVKGMHFQLACQKYFELTHDVSTLCSPLEMMNEAQRLFSLCPPIISCFALLVIFLVISSIPL